MKTIYKCLIPSSGRFTLPLPKNSLILTVQVQRESPVVWALVDTEKAIVKRKFCSIGTGEKINDGLEDDLFYIGSFQLNDGELVFHLFEIME